MEVTTDAGGNCDYQGRAEHEIKIVIDCFTRKCRGLRRCLTRTYRRAMSLTPLPLAHLAVGA